MKFKKLLPLAGMTGIAAIATPLVTSCNKGTEIVWKSGEELPKIEVRDDTFKNADAATDAYFEAIDKDNALLSKDIVHSNYNTDLFGEISSSSVRTDKVNKDKHTVSFTNKVEGKIEGIKVTDTFEVKNAEFVVAPLDLTEFIPGELNYFAPRILVEVVYAIYEGTPKAFMALMDYVNDLVNDHSWYYEFSTVDKKSSITWRLDHNNIYEYSSLQTYETLIDFPILSHYFEEVTITEA